MKDCWCKQKHSSGQYLAQKKAAIWHNRVIGKHNTLKSLNELNWIQKGKGGLKKISSMQHIISIINKHYKSIQHVILMLFTYLLFSKIWVILGIYKVSSNFISQKSLDINFASLVNLLIWPDATGQHKGIPFIMGYQMITVQPKAKASEWNSLQKQTSEPLYSSLVMNTSNSKINNKEKQKVMKHK